MVTVSGLAAVNWINCIVIIPCEMEGKVGVCSKKIMMDPLIKLELASIIFFCCLERSGNRNSIVQLS